MQRDAALAELLGELVRRVRVLLRDQRREHLDDRHLAPEPTEDRRELTADDPATENDQAGWNLGLGEQSLGVDAAIRVESRDRRAQRERAGGDDRGLEAHILPAVHGERVCVLERSRSPDPLDAVGLEQERHAPGHPFHGRGLPLVRHGKLELRRVEPDAELAEGFLGLFQRERRLHPCLGRDAADAQACPAQLRLALDARHACTELCRTDRSGIASRAAPENGDVDVHHSLRLGGGGGTCGWPWRSHSRASRARSGLCRAAGHRRAGTSRLKASAPAGRKNGSLRPQMASSGGWWVRK